MIRKYSISIALAVVTTLGVLFIMQALIATAKKGLDESGTRHFVDFVRAEREETLQRKERKRDKPPEPDAPPPDAMEPRVDSFDPAQVTVGIPMAQLDTDMSIAGLGLVASDGDYLPIVKIEPPYPMAARTRGIEGYCIVEYTVTPAGTVKDVVVIDADPKRIFDKVSIEAALKFKYRPRVVNGEPIEVRGVQNRFLFKLEY
jgi:protein TonB